MSRVLDRPATNGTLAELLDRLGVPPERIRLVPPPGTAKERDVLASQASLEGRLCELVEGTLVEKAMGAKESLLAGVLVYYLWDFLKTHDLGLVPCADGTLKFDLGLVRIPDVCFISWQRLPNRRLPNRQIPNLVPDLAVEVISPSNTRKEMNRKLHEYFRAGVQLVWYIYPKSRTVVVYTSPEDSVRLDKNATLDGGDVLPGFTPPLRQLFARR